MAKTKEMDKKLKLELEKALVVDKNGIVRKKPRSKARRKSQK